LNKTLNGINEEDFYLKTTEQKWKMIFDVSGATKKYKNLYRIVSAAISVEFRIIFHLLNLFFKDPSFKCIYRTHLLNGKYSMDERKKLA